LMWAVFGVVVTVMLVLDLFVFNRGVRHISTKRALMETALWIGVAVIFGIFVLFEMGSEKALEYYTGYIVEKAMSVDNLFVFILIFSLFAIPDEYQHKALFYGIIGAILFRAIFIVVGAELLDNFDIMMYIFGAILIYAAIKTMMKKEEGENKVAKFLCKHLKTSPELDGAKLFTVYNGAKVITPLLLCIIVIELTDIIFAVDSIPAVLAITTDMFIVYTSNIFAILGLRSLYFAIRGSLSALAYLKYGLGIILVFVGFKLITAEFIHIGIPFSLGFICIVLLVTIVFSLMKNRADKARGIA
jgi:tellurite resistance protein TerC